LICLASCPLTRAIPPREMRAAGKPPTSVRR